MVVQLSWLRTFVTVYRLGSLTKAAQRLELSQPTVTHQIRNLERTFGKELFERVPQGVVPTCAADSLIRDVQVRSTPSASWSNVTSAPAPAAVRCA